MPEESHVLSVRVSSEELAAIDKKVKALNYESPLITSLRKNLGGPVRPPEITRAGFVARVIRTVVDAKWDEAKWRYEYTAEQMRTAERQLEFSAREFDRALGDVRFLTKHILETEKKAPGSISNHLAKLRDQFQNGEIARLIETLYAFAEELRWHAPPFTPPTSAAPSGESAAPPSSKGRRAGVKSAATSRRSKSTTSTTGR